MPAVPYRSQCLVRQPANSVDVCWNPFKIDRLTFLWCVVYSLFWWEPPQIYPPWNWQFAPENRPSQKDISIIPTIHFQVQTCCSFQGVRNLKKTMGLRVFPEKKCRIRREFRDEKKLRSIVLAPWIFSSHLGRYFPLSPGYVLTDKLVKSEHIFNASAKYGRRTFLFLYYRKTF